MQQVEHKKDNITPLHYNNMSLILLTNEQRMTKLNIPHIINAKQKCYCRGQQSSIMSLTVHYLMLSVIILKKLADCNVITPIAIGISLNLNISSLINRSNYMYESVCICMYVVYPAVGQCHIQCLLNPFLLHEICFSQCQTITKRTWCNWYSASIRIDNVMNKE